MTINHVVLALQRRFTLLRHFESYYDVSARELPNFELHWLAIAPEGDRHEKDHSTFSSQSRSIRQPPASGQRPNWSLVRML